MRRNSLILCLILCLCLSGCGQKNTHIEGTFGSDDNSISTETDNQKSGVEIKVESNEDDKFKVTDEDVDLTTTKPVKSEEEKSIEKAESEYQSMDESGNITDSRDSTNYYGLLQFIKNNGGIEKVASTYDREKFTDELNKFNLVSESEKEQVLEAIYNESSEERNLLIRDILHTEDGWVYTDDGWTNVYEQDNGLNIKGIGN